MSHPNLNELATEHLNKAKNSSAGRSAVTVYGGREHRLRQTLIALKESSGLGEHASPGEATLQILAGSVTFTSESGAHVLKTGDVFAIPDELHAVDANEDSVFLLTVSKRQSYKD